MVPALALLITVVVIGGIVVNVSLRRWVREESRHEVYLRDPGTPTVAYAIPNGMDPVTVETALARAGFDSGVDRVGTVHCVRIECDPAQRERVRGVLEGIPTNGYDGSQLQTRHVVFEDEH
jgi:hypothetical protein